MITFIPRNPGTPAALRAALVVRDDGPGLRVPQIRKAAWLHLKGLRADTEGGA